VLYNSEVEQLKNLHAKFYLSPNKQSYPSGTSTTEMLKLYQELLF